MTTFDTSQSPVDSEGGAARFRYPIYFVHRVLSDWPELMGPAADIPAPEQCVARMASQGRDHWTLQTYLRLKARGDDVHLAGEYVPDQINVMHYDDLSLRDRPDRAFIVAIQPDRPRAAAADVRLVQNAMQIRGRNDHLVYLWPQPGLIAREADRGNVVERVGYLGSSVYLAEAFRNELFRRRLGEMGMELVIRDRDHTNCADLDVILAVRDVTPFDLSIKPPSKLVNAWMAGCAAILGEEPAYRQLRKSPLDYLEVRTPDEAIKGLRRLKEEPGLYRRMIEHGRERAGEFTIEIMCRRWEGLLSGPVTAAYERWLRQSSARRVIGFGVRCLEHKRQRRRFFRLIRKR